MFNGAELATPMYNVHKFRHTLAWDHFLAKLSGFAPPHLTWWSIPRASLYKPVTLGKGSGGTSLDEPLLNMRPPK